MNISGNICIQIENNWSSLTNERQGECLALTLPEGYMKPWVKLVSPMVFIITSNGDPECLGWGAFDSSEGTAMLFTSHQYRARGIGTIIMNSIISVASALGLRVKVYPWDDVSESMFKNVAARTPAVEIASIYKFQNLFPDL